MKQNNIVIIGNGFDLALNMPTKYEDFVNSKYWPIQELDSIHYGEDNLYNFLYKHTEEHRNELGEVRWIDLEGLLLDYVKSKEYPSGSNSFKSKKEISDLDKEILEYDKRIYALIKTKFSEYLINVAGHAVKTDCQLCQPVTKVMKSIVANGTFGKIYTFNYTGTDGILEFLYKWRPSVVSIHGEAVSTSPHIILGIGETDEVPRDYRFMLKSYDPAYHHNDLADDMIKADEIVFYGLSFGEADWLYFKRFFQDAVQGYKSGQKKKYVHIITWDETSRQAILDSFLDSGLRMTDVYSCINLRIYVSKGYPDYSHGEEPFSEFAKHMEDAKSKMPSIITAEVDRFMGNRGQFEF